MVCRWLHVRSSRLLSYYDRLTHPNEERIRICGVAWHRRYVPICAIDQPRFNPRPAWTEIAVDVFEVVLDVRDRVEPIIVVHVIDVPVEQIGRASCRERV